MGATTVVISLIVVAPAVEPTLLTPPALPAALPAEPAALPELEDVLDAPAGVREPDPLLSELVELEVVLETRSITTARVKVLSAILAEAEIFPSADESRVRALVGRGAFAEAVSCCPAVSVTFAEDGAARALELDCAS